MSTLFIDIETIPSQQPGALEKIRSEISAPGNMSKPETIAKWMSENADSAADEKWRKTALDGSQGEILCIGWSIGDSLAQTIIRPVDGCEKTLLRDFYASVDSCANSWPPHRIVGHNVKDFDLRFLFQRSVINGIIPSFPLCTSNRFSAFIFDTMLAWSGWGNRISLKNLCAALGIEAKTGDIDGSKVWDAAQAGRYEDIAKYCQRDVDATREVFSRLTFNGEYYG